MINWKILLAFIPATLIAGYFLLQWSHSTQSVVNDVFYLDDDYDTVRKVFVRTDVVEKILAANNAEIVDKKIEGLSIGADRLFKNPNWVVDLNGFVKIRFNDPKFKKEIVLRQYANITPERLTLTGYMTHPQDELQRYQINLQLFREGSRTRAELNMLVGITYHAPNLKCIHDKVELALNNRLQEGVARTKSTIQSCVSQYRGKKFIFRLPVDSLKKIK